MRCWLGTGLHASACPGRGVVDGCLYHLIVGDVEAASDWLSKAVGERDLMTVIQVRAPLTAPLRAAARWPSMARELHLPATP